MIKIRLEHNMEFSNIIFCILKLKPTILIQNCDHNLTTTCNWIKAEYIKWNGGQFKSDTSKIWAD
jgi:hypothetical protein